jgi:NDP-4-keto-2,6-dideoxyhexose 3-C-methyltransferase
MRSCRSCGCSVTSVMDLGYHRLPDFTVADAPKNAAYPLHLVMCDSCSLLQLNETTPRNLLYHDRYGFKSGVNEAIRDDLVDVVGYALAARHDAKTWLDIACNDGTLLSAVPRDVHRTGIDPLQQFASEAASHANEVISNFFSPQYFSDSFDIITSVSMFYDLDDPNEFARDVASVLAADGIWVIQQNYAADMLRWNAVDNICHEHVTYFSVTSLKPLLERHGLEINDVSYSSVNGGCFRVLVSRQGSRHISSSVDEALSKEQYLKMSDPETYRKWSGDVRDELAKTSELLNEAKDNGKRVMVYGASTRGGTILQMIGAGSELLVAAVERNPAKVGLVMVSAGIGIISEKEMRVDPPDYLLVSPWFFRDVFVKREADYLKNGGVMIFPLPEFEMVTG